MAFVLAVFAVLIGIIPIAELAQPSTGGLRIVVIEGEDAVNIIQQRTAVAPLVEVRDANNLPVGGATVTFAVGQGASFGGAPTLTVVTNAAGQAAAKGLTPTLPGALRVDVTAVHQNLKASTTISQTNYMTASQAAQAAAANGGGGGVSGKTIAILGGVLAAGGAGAAVALGGSGSSTPETSTPATPTSTPAPSPTPISAPDPTPPPAPTPAPAPAPSPAPTPACAAPGVRPDRIDSSSRDTSFDITVTSTGCAWAATNLPSWVQLDPGSSAGSATPRLRVNNNPSASSRTAQITFSAGTASTNLVVNQEGTPQSITYSGTAGSVTVQYSSAGGGGDNGVCTYTTTISDISASITALEENLTAGQVTLTANETANRFCTAPAPLGQSQHVYSLSQGSLRNNSLDARFSASGSNRPQASLQLTGARGGGQIDANLVLSRTDSSGALNWRVTQRIVLNPR